MQELVKVKKRPWQPSVTLAAQPVSSFPSSTDPCPVARGSSYRRQSQQIQSTLGAVEIPISVLCEDVSEAPPHPGLTLVDKVTGDRNVVDTGAVKSAIPRHKVPPGTKIFPTSISLVAAGSQTIHVHGTAYCQVYIGDMAIVWRFIVAEVKRTLLGADLLEAYGLVVDVGRRLLLDSK